jgi:hypothetical protein
MVAQSGGGEFWRDLKPIEQVFRHGAAPEAYISQAATDDDRFYAPLSETVEPARCGFRRARTGGATS